MSFDEMYESDPYHKVRENLMEQEERVIWEAAKEKAEAVVFTNGNLEIEEMSGNKFSVTSRKYLICESILEVSGFKTTGEPFSYIEIPAYLHRLAEETDDFYMFKQKLEHEHPSMEREE